MKLKEIHRTSTFAWSPTSSLPLLATGTVAGALDESFSNNGQLEIWAPDFVDKNEFDLGGEGQPGARASVTTSSRFNRLAWGYADGPRERGVLVAGMENGELDIWDPSKILAHADVSESLILRNKTHSGPIRGLDFNPIQTNLFASGAVNGEIYIWDLKDPSKPYSPGTRSTKLDEITALAWNHHVQYALAASSSTGFTVVWDLRGKREVAALAYGGGAGTLAGGVQGFASAGMAVGGRRGMSDVAWHPDNATRLVTSSEDDTSPIIMVWDLRNARAPEKILTGHEKGVLSLSWCKQDADLLLSCGKDNRALCWNPQTSEIIGELPSADNWAFQVDWCPRNPDLFATALFDGTIGVHSIQSTNEANEARPAVAPRADGSDVFDAPGFSRAAHGTLSLKQPPKWLRRPTSNSFGYGGKLVTMSNLPSAHGKHQSAAVHLRKVVTEPSIVERAKKLQSAIESENLNEFAEEKSAETGETGPETSAGWKALLSLFKANSRDELITLLGFSKEEIATRVAEAVASLKAAPTEATEDTATSLTEQDVDEDEYKPHEPVVSFAEPEREPTPESSELGDDETLDASAFAAENTPSEVSTGAASDITNATRQADGESTTTAPSLFGDDNLNGAPQTDAAADFFGSIGLGGTSNEAQMQVPHHNYPLDSSVAATIGSGPSSVVSESLRNNTFKIYPPDESETDHLVTKALVLGDFESAVSLCLSSDRFADAILLAARGGPELLQRTQKAYFERRTIALPYLRLFQSIVSNDLADIVQNADLQEWQEIFVVLCTFASQEEFPSLAEQLGLRLEFQSSLAKESDADNADEIAREFRKHATLTFLAAGRLERLVNIWIEDMAEEEKASLAEDDRLDGSRYTAHALALQTFIEKVTVFRSAINYKDPDLEQTAGGADASARSYKLAPLYDRYFEYADLLAAQGMVKEAVAFLKLTPPEYQGTPGSYLDFSEVRQRILAAAGPSAVPARTTSLPAAATLAAKAAPVASTSAVYGYGQYAAPVQQQPLGVPAPVAVPPAYDVYHAPQVAGPYAPPVAAQLTQPTYQSSAQYGHPRGQPQPAQVAPIAPPPPRAAPAPPPPKGGPIKRENGGWNDAPTVNQRRTPNSLNLSKPAAITAPFPNAPSPGIMPGTPPHSGAHGHPPQTLPPPPRPGSVQQPPPPPHGQRGPPPLQGPGPYPPQMRPPSGPPGPQHTAPPPQRILSPPQGQGLRGPPPPAQYAPPPQRGGPMPGQTPPPPAGHPPGPGPYNRVEPSPSYAPGPTPPPAQQGHYAPTPQQGSFAPPPPQKGTYAPRMVLGSSAPPPPVGEPMTMPPGQGIGQAGPPPPPPGAPRVAAAAAAPRAKPGPPQPKYPNGDRSHIPENMMPVFTVISEQLSRLKQTTPPQQKRLVDDLERRINPLFDALNCETLSKPVCDQLLVLVQAMAAHDRDAAMGIHIELLTRGSLTDDIGIWMSGIKQLIMRL